MDRKPPKPSREERLAAKLRENLRRRKAQSRTLSGEMHPPHDAEQDSLPKERGNS